MGYQFKIQIKGLSKPPVWRKVVVPADFTFLMFHKVIQIAFGWGDCHLFEFTDREHRSNIFISMPDQFKFGYCDELLNASEVKLAQIFGGKYSKFLYEYDFGDGWVHLITLEAVLDDKSQEAVCISGKGCCPPEECGGIYGYEDIKIIFNTAPHSEQANELRGWLELGDDQIWDANAFDIDGINDCLRECVRSI